MFVALEELLLAFELLVVLYCTPTALPMSSTMS